MREIASRAIAIVERWRATHLADDPNAVADADVVLAALRAIARRGGQGEQEDTDYCWHSPEHCDCPGCFGKAPPA